MKISGAVAIVTGGARGFGKGFSEALLKRGARVCFADVNAVEGKQTEADFKKEFGDESSLFVKCDVTDDADFKGLFDAAIKQFKNVDIMVNNAGILNENEWQKTIDINMVGALRGTYMAVEHMRKDKGGNGGLILNVASSAGIFPAFFMPAYVASKHGTVGFTRSWAANPLSQKTFGISFACLCPAFSSTSMFNDTIGAADPPLLTYQENKTVIEDAFKVLGVNSVEDVVKAFIEVVEKDDNNGAVVTVDKLKGINYRYAQHPHRL